MLSEIISNLRENHHVYFGSDSEPEIEATLTISHPNSRTTCLSVKWLHEEKTLFLKLLYPDQVDGRSNRSDRNYKEDQIQVEYDVLKNLYQAFVPYPDLGVVKPVACFPKYLALVTEEQPGLKFSSIMRNVKIYSGQDRIRNLVNWTSLCGRWLRLFQGFMQRGGDERYDFKEVFDYSDVRLNILVQYRPGEFRERFCESIRNFLREQVEQLRQDDLQVVGRHNDFSPNNMIISGQKLVLLDFSGFKYGPVHSDYVKFWSGLDEMRGNLLISVKTIEKLQEAFTTGYGRKIDPDDPLFTLFYVAYILDKMGDIWLDWSTLGWMRRPIYKKLYCKYLAWLKDRCRS